MVASPVGVGLFWDEEANAWFEGPASSGGGPELILLTIQSTIILGPMSMERLSSFLIKLTLVQRQERRLGIFGSSFNFIRRPERL